MMKACRNREDVFFFLKLVLCFASACKDFSFPHNCHTLINDTTLGLQDLTLSEGILFSMSECNFGILLQVQHLLYKQVRENLFVFYYLFIAFAVALHQSRLRHTKSFKLCSFEKLEIGWSKPQLLRDFF